MFRIVPSPTTISRSLPLRYQLIHPQFGSRLLSRRPAVSTSKSVLEPSVEEQFEDSSVAAEAKYEPLTTQQVKELVTLVCKETKLAQVELKLGSFEVKIKRKVGHSTGGEVHAPANVANNGAVDSVPLPSVEGSTVEDSFFEDESMSSFEESLILVDSPKVGIFRHGVFNKNGKKVGKGPKVGDEVKKGQVVCAIEQLGTLTPISAPQQGEILSFPFSEGEPVAYKDAIVEFAPFFGGHIIGDKKYK